jgi:hypothetical protein
MRDAMNVIEMKRIRVGAGFLAALALAAAGQASADGHVYPLTSETYKTECGTSCHVAYPPQLLPAASWRTLMAGLDKHFGTDASLDPKVAREIGDYLDAAAGTKKKVSADGAVLRISETRWFGHEHGEGLPASVWSNPKVKSPANCETCHIQAAKGDYSERSLRVPR